MSTSGWMIELGRTAWRLAADDADAAPVWKESKFTELEFIEQAEQVRGTLVDVGYSGQPLILALASDWCLNATLDVSQPAEFRDRRTMLFRLEECIPWNAEDFVADYLRTGSSALAAAIPAAPLTEFVNRLERLGVLIHSIVPLALLACQEHTSLVDSATLQLVAFEQNHWIDLCSIDNGRPKSWSTILGHDSGLIQEIRKLSLDTGATLPLIGYGLRESTIAEIERTGVAAVQHTSESTTESAATLALSATRKILDGKLEPPIELKRGPFGDSRQHVALRPYALALQAAVLLLIVSLMGIFAVRGQLAARQADALNAKQTEIFQRTYPNTKVPVGVKGRLESELVKLKGLQGNDTTLPSTASAIAMLHDLLKSLPTDRRFMLLEIRIEEGRLYLDGEVREHGDAEAIAQRLRASGFEVASPRTQRVDEKRVSLRITGTRPITKVATRKLP